MTDKFEFQHIITTRPFQQISTDPAGLKYVQKCFHFNNLNKKGPLIQ